MLLSCQALDPIETELIFIINKKTYVNIYIYIYNCKGDKTKKAQQSMITLREQVHSKDNLQARKQAIVRATQGKQYPYPYFMLTLNLNKSNDILFNSFLKSIISQNHFLIHYNIHQRNKRTS